MVPQRSPFVHNTLPYTLPDPINLAADHIGFQPQFAVSAKIVSFKEDTKPPTLLSPYDPSWSYLEQAYCEFAELGSGSFGIVYAATSRADGRQYAIKQMRNVYRSHKRRNRTLQEVRIHESLPPHKNLVNFVMAWEERDRLYIQMELCHRHTLADMRQCTAYVPESAVLEWTKDMASALAHLHGRKDPVIHLDVKPDNMFIGLDGNIKLGDFGSARLASNNNGKVYDGDGRYLAPEILNNPPTTAADVYSLGMSMLELASGVDFASPKYTSHRDARSAALSFIHRGLLKRRIRAMTHLTPEKRPSASFVLDIIFWVEYLT